MLSLDLAAPIGDVRVRFDAIESSMPRTWRLRRRGSDARTSAAACAAASSEATASRPMRSAVDKVTTSATFSVPNASHARSDSSRLDSASMVYGTCSNEHDDDTATEPVEPSSVARVPGPSPDRCATRCGRPPRPPRSACPPGQAVRRCLPSHLRPGRPRGLRHRCERVHRAPDRGCRNRSDEDRRTVLCLRQRAVHLFDRGDGRVVEIADECGLVELHPLDSGGGELRQEVLIQRDQLIGTVEERALFAGGLRQQQERQRADDYRAGRNAERAGLGDSPSTFDGSSEKTVSGPISGTR